MTSVQKNCKACGEIITVRLADHRRGWGNFCDKACAAAYKCGQRPRDVNAAHAKFSSWAADRWALRERLRGGKEPPKAPTIKEQLGKEPRVVKKHHSPKKNTTSQTVFGEDEQHDDQARWDSESGWDGHKIWTF